MGVWRLGGSRSMRNGCACVGAERGKAGRAAEMFREKICRLNVTSASKSC